MSIKVLVHIGDLNDLTTHLLAIPRFEDSAADPEVTALLSGDAAAVIEEEQFTGKKDQMLLLHRYQRTARVLLCGAGKRKDFTVQDLRVLAAKAVRQAEQRRLSAVAFALPADLFAEASAQSLAAQCLTEGALLGAYRFDKYWTGERRKPQAVTSFTIVGSGAAAGQSGAWERGVRRGVVVAGAVARARDLVNEPAGHLTPTRLAELATSLAAERGLTATVLGPSECRELGMGMYLAVAQGSDEEPRFIHLCYRPRPDAKPDAKPEGARRVALIGKGVTFDSGGLSLKPSQAMEDMKIDMAGGAAVLSAILALAELGSPHEVHAIVAATENMPSGRAYKLGDVLRSMAGKTVEINNTDAEGRLTLGDAMTYAVQKVKAEEIIDIATLTGACMVALGPYAAGLMGNNEGLIGRVVQAGKGAGEELWPLPLPERLKEQLKSEVADMRNTGERWGGALTAGLFLREFAGDTAWVHLDIAGPAAATAEWGHQGKGGTGFGVATLIEYLSPRE